MHEFSEVPDENALQGDILGTSCSQRRTRMHSALNQPTDGSLEGGIRCFEGQLCIQVRKHLCIQLSVLQDDFVD